MLNVVNRIEKNKGREEELLDVGMGVLDIYAYAYMRATFGLESVFRRSSYFLLFIRYNCTSRLHREKRRRRNTCPSTVYGGPMILYRCTVPVQFYCVDVDMLHMCMHTELAVDSHERMHMLILYWSTIVLVYKYIDCTQY